MRFATFLGGLARCEAGHHAFAKVVSVSQGSSKGGHSVQRMQIEGIRATRNTERYESRMRGLTLHNEFGVRRLHSLTKPEAWGAGHLVWDECQEDSDPRRRVEANLAE